jgi:hypothetical protein
MPKKRRSVYSRIVWAIADELGITYSQARPAYKPLKQWLVDHDETLSRAAVERHPRVTARALVQGQATQVRAREATQAQTELRRIQQTKTVTPAAPVAGTEVEEWEVTVKYTVGGRGKHRGEVVDITLRLVGRPGERFTSAQVRAAAWYAMKHGPDSLKDFSVEAIDWYNQRRSGQVEEYHYTESGMETALENARGLFHRVGLGGLRVALVE